MKSDNVPMMKQFSVNFKESVSKDFIFSDKNEINGNNKDKFKNPMGLKILKDMSQRKNQKKRSENS